MPTDTHSQGEREQVPRAVQTVLDALEKLKFGAIQLTVHEGRLEIGRASCRERVSVRVDLGGRRIITKKRIDQTNKKVRHNDSNRGHERRRVVPRSTYSDRKETKKNGTKQ